MRFWKMLCSDLQRLFASWQLYATIAGVLCVCAFSLSEVIWRQDISLYTLANVRHGIGFFLMAITVLSALPYSLSYREDVKNGYFYCIRNRVTYQRYCCSKVLVTAIGTFFAILTGYLLFFLFMRMLHPTVSDSEMEMFYLWQKEGGLEPCERYFLEGKSVLYFVDTFSIEAMGYALMAVFTLLISVKVKNIFVLLSVPAMFYYGSIIICESLQLPGIFRWYFILQNGGVIRFQMEYPGAMMFAIVGYFGVLIVVCGIFFLKWVGKESLHG